MGSELTLHHGKGVDIKDLIMQQLLRDELCAGLKGKVDDPLDVIQ